LSLRIVEAVRRSYPDLDVPHLTLNHVRVDSSSEGILALKDQILRKAKSNYDLPTLKDYPVFRAYRDFFWRMGIDPTKTRPAGEALIRRVLRGKEIPSINTFVDCYNLASIETGIAMAAFDLDHVDPPLLLRFSESGERFRGIGMGSHISLEGGEVVISDKEGILAIYPYRDAERSKIQLTTGSVILLSCGVPGIDTSLLDRALSIAVKYITALCDGGMD